MLSKFYFIFPQRKYFMNLKTGKLLNGKVSIGEVICHMLFWFIVVIVVPYLQEKKNCARRCVVGNSITTDYRERCFAVIFSITF